MTSAHWREIVCVDDPLDVAGVPGTAGLGRPETVFPFPAIRDSRWDCALDSLASALDLSVRPARSPHVPCDVGEETSLSSLDGRNTGAAMHLVFRGAEFGRVWRIARRYCQLRNRTMGAVGDPEELGRWLLERRGAKPRSLTLWGVAHDFAFPLLEAFESRIHASYFPAERPCLGYMVAEDSRQLLWLAFKTLLLWRVRPMSWPDGLSAKGEDDGFHVSSRSSRKNPSGRER